MNIRQYLTKKYEAHPSTMLGTEAKVFGIPYPLRPGWLEQHGDREITAGMAEALRSRLGQRGGKSAARGITILSSTSAANSTAPMQPSNWLLARKYRPSKPGYYLCRWHASPDVETRLLWGGDQWIGPAWDGSMRAPVTFGMGDAGAGDEWLDEALAAPTQAAGGEARDTDTPAFKQGVEEFKRGFKSNPYPYGKNKRGWQAGYDEAKALAAAPAAAVLPPYEVGQATLREAVQFFFDALDRHHDTKNPPAKYTVPWGAVNALRATLTAFPAAAAPEGLTPATEYARNLAVALHRDCYPEVTQWKPLDDLLGLLTQIDNMVSGMARIKPATPDAKTAEVRKALTAGQITRIWMHNGGDLARNRFQDFARAIEREHGIGDQP